MQINFKGNISDNQWEEFQKEVQQIAQKFNLSVVPETFDNLVLIKLAWDGWRGFQGIQEHFVCATENGALILKEIKGKNIDFGEIAGKHSDVSGQLDEQTDIQVITDQSLIKEFTKKHGTYFNNGHSFLQAYLVPLQYEDEESCERFKNLIKNIVD
jgi:hypothetical protein